LEGLGKGSGCKYVKSAAPDVHAKLAAVLASRAAGKAMKKKTEEHRNAILVRTRDLLPTHVDFLPTVIHPRENLASP
jgi:acyl-CoA reductase-like NAD-dependent aldehyde dehydrogenase